MRQAVLAGLIVTAFGSISPSEAGPRTFTFEDRVAAQKAIEQVYWNHRIWPKENPGQKPPLSDAMNDGALRAKVDDYLRKSNALETWWQRPIAGEQLQAEIDRMAKGSRDPQVLRELFAALGNDAFVIAETLARQTLADRLIRNWYTNDTRFHADARAKAEAARAWCASVDCMKSMGGEYRETTLVRGGDVPTAGEWERGVVRLESEDWTKELDRLAAGFGTTAGALSSKQLSGLEETTESFSISAVLSKKRDEITTATVVWTKLPFEVWWTANRAAQSSSAADERAAFTLRAMTSTECTNDTWQPTFQDRPDGRYYSPAVWTGTEMIFWGGLAFGGMLNTGGRYNPSTDSWALTSIGANTPVPRYAHTAVWTGTEMIVWGGSNFDIVMSTGGRYNPSTDSWVATSNGPNVPTARYNHTAVWTGTEMIVWGGNYQSQYFNTGGRYDPSTDGWTATSTDGDVPTGTTSHTAVWTGTEMIVWGGYAFFGKTNEGGRYDPSTDSWVPTSVGAGVPIERAYHVAVWTGTQMIIWGGSGSTALSSGGRYTPSTDTWLPTSMGASVPATRSGHTAIWTGTEMIIWGGVYCDGTCHYLNTGGRYSPSTNSWTATSTAANVPGGRYAHTAVWTGTELIVWGGADFDDYGLPTGGRYNPTTNTWVGTSMGNVPPERDFHTAVWTGAEMIVWGGAGFGDQYLNTGGLYYPSTDTWLTTSMGANVPTMRDDHTAVWTGTHMIVWGGHNLQLLNTGGRYSPSTDTWTTTATGANVPARSSHTAVWTGTEMIVWGGSSIQNDGGRYSPSTDSWVATSVGANVPAGRYHHTAVWTGAEMIVWGGYGGSGSSTELNSGGRYVPASNSWMATSTGANSPLQREYHSAVWTGTEMIVWGGNIAASTFANTGGRYNPSTDSWVATSTGANVPTTRYGHTAVWTGMEMIVWGGRTDGDRFLSTGDRYNASMNNWTTTSTGMYVPGARYIHRAVWTGTEMIVWGGFPTTSTGGRYCACLNAQTVYRDVDADGYGDPSVTAITNCDGSIPAGYAAGGTDCDDTNAAIHPNAAEINDGVDNQCPGDANYGVIDEISGLSGFSTLGDKTKFSWDAQGSATSYDVVRSTTRDFSSGCTVFSSSQAFVIDVELPPADNGFYYLVRPSAPHVGSWGQSGDGTPRAVSCL